MTQSIFSSVCWKIELLSVKELRGRSKKRLGSWQLVDIIGQQVDRLGVYRAADRINKTSKEITDKTDRNLVMYIICLRQLYMQQSAVRLPWLTKLKLGSSEVPLIGIQVFPSFHCYFSFLSPRWDDDQKMWIHLGCNGRCVFDGDFVGNPSKNQSTKQPIPATNDRKG